MAIDVTIDDGICTIVINRPERLNAMDAEHYRALSAAWSRYPTLESARLGTTTLLADDRIVRVMIVRNEIPPAFVEWVER